MAYLAEIIVTVLTRHPLALLASAVLLCVSATFSGCETSLFSLTAPQLNRVRASRGRLDRLIVRLHANLKPLLPTILFCNMAVNVLIYSLSAAIAGPLGERHGGGAALAFGLCSLFMVVFFGEVFPKQLAIASSLMVARITALPVWLCYRATARPMRVLNGLVSAIERVADHERRDGGELREEELRLLVELSKKDGVISDGEYELIDGIVELPEVRIRDIMVPRVDVAPLPPESDLGRALEAARRARHCKIPVLAADRDDLAGWIDVRDIFAEHAGDPRSPGTAEEYLRPFRFFSEHDRADQVLERIKGGGGDLFAVVDERGWIVGFFTLQDIMDEVLGHFGEHGDAPPDIVREENGLYVISGRISVKEWRELFKVSESIPRSATLGGLIVSLLGRVPKPGDRVSLNNMEMTVRSTRHNRVNEVELRLVAAAGGGEAD